ncbi:MAG: DUF5686 and carboxypeptidase regulatory-like domain-containing protein [Chitinophagaceae bacterium]|nr:DUF5686 and carboxypeptidase regulatory-like domain-containing protein [Chitinophagaceae bacterium]
MQKLITLFLMLQVFQARSATVSGLVKDKSGNPIAFASIIIKGTTKGTTANAKGFYSLEIEPGTHLLIAQHVGYKSVEKTVKVTATVSEIDFELEVQQYNLKEVVVNSGAEDPAYAIIRNTISKREAHLKEIKKFQCEVYLKGQLQLRNYPKNFMGKTVDFEDGDTSKRKMIFLSESIVKYAVEEPKSRKIDVISSKVGGQSDGFGFADPQIISFYENIVPFGAGLNPRGFVSPIANNALYFYKYKFEGTFFENGSEISRIKVIPKRKYEPLFSGYINIVEDEWRIQSVQLRLLKEQAMQLLDTLMIEQLYSPAPGNVWVIKSQVLYPSGKIFGFEFFGNFLQVYDKFNLNPTFKKTFFDHTILKFEDSASKKTMAYWDSIRPIPLVVEEKKTYKKLDSLETERKNPHYLDSLDKRRNKFTILGFLLTGNSISVQKKKTFWVVPSVLNSFFYNTVEGGSIDFVPYYIKKYKGQESLSIATDIRYGLANQHFNPSVSVNYRYGKKYVKNISLSGGAKVFQFNNESPILPVLNTFITLNQKYNYMKIYEADFFRFSYFTGLGNGFTLGADFQFQNRKPLENLSDIASWKNYPDRNFTPNYPTEITQSNMLPNKASIFTINASWKPGSNYIELPDQKINIGSKYPTFHASFTQGINGFLGSDVSYSKWNFGITDHLNMKLGGRISYAFGVGGFLNADKLFIPDYQQFQGNQIVIATPYLSSFQLPAYYQFSNSARFHSSAHIEYHLNGLLTNKIPGFRKLNLFFVTGGSALYIQPNTKYYEAYFGIENIFKVLRVDFVQGFEQNGSRPSGFRISVPFVSNR